MHGKVLGEKGGGLERKNRQGMDKNQSGHTRGRREREKKRKREEEKEELDEEKNLRGADCLRHAVGCMLHTRTACAFSWARVERRFPSRKIRRRKKEKTRSKKISTLPSCVRESAVAERCGFRFPSIFLSPSSFLCFLLPSSRLRCIFTLLSATRACSPLRSS